MPNVAIYLDFENLAISADTVYPSADQPLELEPIVDFTARKGNISIKKAYADWSKEAFHQYQQKLQENGFELIHLPETNLQGKNGSDVRLAIDVMENLELYPQIDVVVIGSGDSDFIPVIQRVRSRSKEVITIGFDYSVGRLVKANSTEFKSLEELIGAPEDEMNGSDKTEPLEDVQGRNVLLRYLKVNDNNEPVRLGQLKVELLRLDSSFSEKKLGYPTFLKFIESFKGSLVKSVGINPESQLHEVVFKDVVETRKVTRDVQKEASRFLYKVLRYIRTEAKQEDLSKQLYQWMGRKKRASMREMADFLIETENASSQQKIDLKKFVNILFQSNAFYQVSGKGALLDRPFDLHYSIKNARSLCDSYQLKIKEIMQERYADMNKERLVNLLKD